jgi:GNAT superfamily N-acetyltransferase
MRVRLPKYRIISSKDGWTPGFDARFRAFYDTIFIKAFPDPDMRESPARVRRLSDPRAFGQAEPWGYVNLAIVPWERGWRPAGGILFEWYRNGEAALLTYIVVAPDFRGRGLGRVLLKSALSRLTQETRLVPGASLPLFAETEMHDDEGGPPPARLGTLQSLGFRALDFDYVQPPLDASKAHVTCLKLLAYQPAPAPQPLPAPRVAAFLGAFYRALLGARFDHDAPCQAVLSALSDRKDIAAFPLISHKSGWAKSEGEGNERGGPVAPG